MEFGKIGLLALFALFLSALPSHAEVNVCENGMLVPLSDPASFLSVWSTWQGVVVTAVLIVFTVSAFAYMLAGIISHRGLRVWAQNQMYEGFATFVIAMFIVGLVSWICGFDATYVGATCEPGHCNIFEVAEDYLLQFEGEVSDAWWYIALVNMAIAAIANLTFHMGAPGLGTTVNLGAGMGQVSSSLGSALIAVTVAQVLTLAQVQVLRIAELMFGYLLPAGVVLRSLGATRGFGGALIALAIGFYIVYPGAIVLMYGLVLNNVQNQLGDMPVGGENLDDWQDEAGGLIGQVCGLLGTLCMGAAVVPFVVFIIVVSFTKSLSSQIGDEIDVSNLTKLI